MDGIRRGGARGQGANPGWQVIFALGALFVLTLAGTVGFMLTENLRFIDALYMSVITLSTVGYQEVAPSSVSGRVFTICFILVGVGAALYAVVSVAGYLIEGRLREALGRRVMERAIAALEDHVIVCGYGRLGRAVTKWLEDGGAQVVVVDPDPALLTEFDASGELLVTGSALEESVLRAAGIERARSIVTVIPSDPDNVFVTLSARELNPEIRVHARGDNEAGVRRLRLAGADQVISIHQIGGQRIANAIMRPAVVDFIELAAPGAGAPIDLEEVVLSASSDLAECRVSELANRGVHISVVAIKRSGERTRLAPGPEEALRAGDHVVVVGDRDAVRKLSELAS